MKKYVLVMLMVSLFLVPAMLLADNLVLSNGMDSDTHTTISRAKIYNQEVVEILGFEIPIVLAPPMYGSGELPSLGNISGYTNYEALLQAREEPDYPTFKIIIGLIGKQQILLSGISIQLMLGGDSFRGSIPAMATLFEKGHTITI